MKTFYLVSLGCPKNVVDSGGMAALLQCAGYARVVISEEADNLIVNVCDFILCSASLKLLPKTVRGT
jgi:ribosomal protein S12 methylthiotransferase